MSKNPILRTLATSKRKVNACGGLHFIRGNKAPYFSLTIESLEIVNGRLREDCFGAAHDELVKRWPELAPLAALHLADINGTPMHAIENGLYYVQHLIPGASGRSATAISFAAPSWSGGKPRTDEECIKIFANHFRLDHESANDLLAHLISVANGVSHYERVWGGGSKTVVKAALASWVDAQAPKWKAEADKCIADLGLVVFGDGWKEAITA